MAVKHVTGKLTAIRNHVIVEDMHFGERTLSSGIIIPGDDGEDRGIRPRWGRVHAIGHEQDDVKVGEYVLVTHGRWSRGVDVTNPETGEMVTVRRVDIDDILLVSDRPHEDGTVELSR